MPFMEMWVRFLRSEFYHCCHPIYREMPICTALINGAGLHSGAFLSFTQQKYIWENNRKDPLVHEVPQMSNLHISILFSNSNPIFIFVFAVKLVNK